MGRPAGLALRVAELRQTLGQLMEEAANQSLSTANRRALEAQIRAVMDELSEFLGQLDPIREPVSVFDPSNPKIVGRFVSLALVAQPRHPLAEVATRRFYGSGVYAIYYVGDFPAYRPLSRSETPIYVGQASPAINNARTPREQGDKLSSRLREHYKSIVRASSTLDIADFEFRSLVVQSGWETAAEDYLIHLFRPIWNSETQILFGVGKHGDRAETRANRRSPWDTLHPGRMWAANEVLVDAKSVDQIKRDLDTHFAAHPVFPDLESLLASFIDELRQI